MLSLILVLDYVFSVSFLQSCISMFQLNGYIHLASPG